MDRRQLVVDTKGGADFTSIADAVRAAAPGDAVVLRMGLYEEKVHLSKDIEVCLDAGVEPGEAIINSGVIVTATVVLRNVYIEQVVDVRKGSATLFSCNLSQGSDGVRVCTGAKASLNECVIHDITVGGDGVYVQEGGAVELIKCDIGNCRVNGVHAKGGEVTVKECRIHDCDFGLYFRKGARGAVEGNILERIKSFGIYVTGGSDPVILKNQVKLCDIHGVMISQQGAGTLRDNEVDASVRILRGCAPTLNVNQITGRIDNELAVPTPLGATA
ncbi:Hypothetical protein, putative [Bodo saltans]|uniref:Right handed beta helix domain-containing protein n=1 Tax=Bodo saltans TaxID=75058 RepID=A0A0S4KFM6_BODSA|nr:Hypothetical protein, putative [Bodo saltans]|eukprot:CUI12364.1 Hypothetical protein, putative [Bodo saltans]